MKACINAAEFYAAMKKVSGALHRSSIPALEQIRVDFEDGVCRMTASDFTLWLSIEIPAEGDQFSFMFSNTASVVRACRYYSGDMTVELCRDSGDLKVRFCAGEKSGVFPAEDINLCPVCPSEESQQHYVLDAPVLYERIKKVQYASQVNDANHVLAGVRFDKNHVWCIDGHRIALNDDPGLTVDRRFILPSYALAHLNVFHSEETDLCVGERYAWFTSGGTKLLIRKLVPSDEIYVENVIPAHSAESYLVDRDKLLDAIGYLDGCSRGLPRHNVFFDGRSLSLRNGDFEYSAVLEVDGISNIQYAFDLTLMKDALKQFAGERTVRICVNNKFSPIVIRTDGVNTALLLPVRMQADSRWNAA